MWEWMTEKLQSVVWQRRKILVRYTKAMDITKNRRLAGASVLPYSCDPAHSNIYFLLGNEKKLPRWNDANKWSDFGGSPKKNESESECAGREFHEETVAAVRWDDKENDQRNFFVRQSSLPIIRDLEKGNFSFKMITLIDDDRYYATYVKQVPFDGSVHRRTNNLLNGLNRMRTDIKSGGEHTLSSFEKHPRRPPLRPPERERRGCRRLEGLFGEAVDPVALDRAGPRVAPLGKAAPAVRVRDSFRQRMKVVLDQFEDEFARLNLSEKFSAAPYKRIDHGSSIQAYPSSLQSLTQSTEQQLESSSMSGQRNIQSSNSLPRRPIDANSKMLPLENPRQKFVAIHLGHQQQKIQCPVAQVRVLGFFRDAGGLATALSEPGP